MILKSHNNQLKVCFRPKTYSTILKANSIYMRSPNEFGMESTSKIKKSCLIKSKTNLIHD
jgi:hypothetical protein